MSNCKMNNTIFYTPRTTRSSESVLHTHQAIINGILLYINYVLIVGQKIFSFYELILFLAPKKTEDVMCFNWKFPVLSDLKIDWIEQNDVVAV